MARSSKRTSKPAPITRSPAHLIIEVRHYRNCIEAAVETATGTAKKAHIVEAALDLYIRKKLTPPATLADKKAHIEAIIDHGRKLYSLLSALQSNVQHRDFRVDLENIKTKSEMYPKIFGRPETPINPTIMREFITLKDDLLHVRASAGWVLEHLKKRPPSPAKTLVDKIASVAPEDGQLRTLLSSLNELLEIIRADFGTEDLRLSDPARLVRERKK